MYDVLHERSPRFLRRIGRRGLYGQRSTLIEQINNRLRSFRVMRRGHNLEDILRFGLYAKLGRKKSIIRIVYNTATKGRLDGCFGGQ